MASANRMQAVVQGPPPRYREEWSGCVSWPSDIAGSKRSTLDSKAMWEVRVCLTSLLQTMLHFPTGWRCYCNIITSSSSSLSCLLAYFFLLFGWYLIQNPEWSSRRPHVCCLIELTIVTWKRWFIVPANYGLFTSQHVHAWLLYQKQRMSVYQFIIISFKVLSSLSRALRLFFFFRSACAPNLKNVGARSKI